MTDSVSSQIIYSPINRLDISGIKNKGGTSYDISTQQNYDTGGTVKKYLIKL